MATASAPVSDMLITVKSREVQRGIFAEMAKDSARARQHFLAAAHLELVLADDYEQAAQGDMAFRSRLSSASCFWRAGEIEHARDQFEDLFRDHPEKAQLVREARGELETQIA